MHYSSLYHLEKKYLLLAQLHEHPVFKGPGYKENLK